jgi:hypothetical protein
VGIREGKRQKANGKVRGGRCASDEIERAVGTAGVMNAAPTGSNKGARGLLKNPSNGLSLSGSSTLQSRVSSFAVSLEARATSTGSASGPSSTAPQVHLYHWLHSPMSLLSIGSADSQSLLETVHPSLFSDRKPIRFLLQSHSSFVQAGGN